MLSRSLRAIDFRHKLIPLLPECLLLTAPAFPGLLRSRIYTVPVASFANITKTEPRWKCNFVTVNKQSSGCFLGFAAKLN